MLIENEILKNDILQKSRLYGAKPVGFKYEMTERDSSLVHRTMQEKIVKYENTKVEVEQKKLHIKASTPYSDQKKLDTLKPDIESFCSKVKEIKKILKAINSTPSINESEKRAYIMGVNEELQNGIRKGKLSTTTIKHLHNEAIQKKSLYELEMKPTPEQEEAHKYKKDNKNKLKNS